MPANAIKMVEPSENEFLAQLEQKSGKPSPFYRVMANKPDSLQSFVPFYTSIMGRGSVDRRIKELVYLAVAYINQCAFCTASHTAVATKAGITEQELADLKSENDATFSPAEQAAIRYARELARKANAESSRDALAADFNSEQIVEITLAAAMANFTNRFNNALQVLP